MGVSSDGKVSFGVAFDEDHEFPWDDELEDWWLEVCGWVSCSYYDDDGNRLPGVTDKDIHRHYDEERKFLKENPCPVELVNYCSGEYPMYILAVAGTVQNCSRGNPTKLKALGVVDVTDYLRFCEEHGIDLPDEPCWLLSSYMG